MFKFKDVAVAVWWDYALYNHVEGYKALADRLKLPRSATRYARKALRMKIVPEIVAGWITDQRVVGILASLPIKLARMIVRIEARLRRKLTRSRLVGLLLAFAKVTSLSEVPEAPCQAGHQDKRGFIGVRHE